MSSAVRIHPGNPKIFEHRARTMDSIAARVEKCYTEHGKQLLQSCIVHAAARSVRVLFQGRRMAASVRNAL